MESNKQKIVSKSGKNDLKPFHENKKEEEEEARWCGDVNVTTVRFMGGLDDADERS